MKVDEKILFRLKELLEFGEQVIATKRNPQLAEINEKLDKLHEEITRIKKTN